MAHNAAIGLMVASSLVALGGSEFGRWEYDKGRTISPRAAVAGLTGAVGLVVAVVLLGLGV